MTLRRLLAGGCLLLGALICLAGLYGFAALHLPMIMRDLVDIQARYLRGDPLWPALFHTHVDHILAFQRLLAWIDVNWLGAQQWASLAANLLSCLGFGLLAAWGARRSGGTATAAWLAGVGSAAGLLWLANGFNLFWAMQAHFFMAPLFTLAAASLLVLQPAPGEGRLLAVFILAALGALASGSGLVGLIALAVLAAVLRLPRRTLLLLLAGLPLLALAVLWLRDQTHRPRSVDLSVWLEQPRLILDYLRYYLDNPAELALRPLLPAFQARLFADIALGLALLALAWRWLRMLRPGGRPSPLAAQGHLLCLLAIGSGLVTALVRLEAGPGQAAAQRYITTELLFWIGLVLIAIDLARTARPGRQALGLAALFLLLGLLLAGLPRYWDRSEARHGEQVQAATALLSGSDDSEPLARLHPNLAHARRAFALLRAWPGGIWTRPEAAWIGQPAGSLFAAGGGPCPFTPLWLPAHTTSDGNRALAGWRTRGQPLPDYILLLTPEGRIGALTWPAGGVRAQERPREAAREGWELWLTPAQQQGRLAAVRDGELCILPWP